MAWEPAADAEHFILGLFKKPFGALQGPHWTPRRSDRRRDALRFLLDMEQKIRARAASSQL